MLNEVNKHDKGQNIKKKKKNLLSSVLPACGSGDLRRQGLWSTQLDERWSVREVCFLLRATLQTHDPWGIANPWIRYKVIQESELIIPYNQTVVESTVKREKTWMSCSIHAKGWNTFKRGKKHDVHTSGESKHYLHFDTLPRLVHLVNEILVLCECPCCKSSSKRRRKYQEPTCKRKARYDRNKTKTEINYWRILRTTDKCLFASFIEKRCSCEQLTIEVAYENTYDKRRRMKMQRQCVNSWWSYDKG